MTCCFCREYAYPLDNPYYYELGQKLGIPSRILRESPHWYAIPTLGCLTRGYILLVCKQHYSSLANLDKALFFEMLNLKKNMEQTIFQKMGVPCLAFEHGTPDPSAVGANSVDHVHLHILPFPNVIWPNLFRNNSLEGFISLTDYSALYEIWRESFPRTYLLFQDTDGTVHYKPDASNLPSQYFRKCLAPYLHANQWDWRLEQNPENFIETYKLFR